MKTGVREAFADGQRALERQPLVHAIVVNYNGWSDTVECLESLFQSDYARLRVIVVENGSTDDSLVRLQAWLCGAEFATQFDRRSTRHGLNAHVEPSVAFRTRDQLLRNAADAPSRDALVTLVDCGANLGFAGGTNVGLRHVLRGDPSDYALLLNNDAVVAVDAIRALVAEAQRTEHVGAVGATILYRDRPDTIEMLGGATVSPSTGMVTPIQADTPRGAPRPNRIRLDYVSGCCLLVSAAVVGRVGLIDERYFLYSEDVDWGIQMRRTGLSLTYCPTAEVWHKGGASVVHRSATHDYYVVRGSLLLVMKNFPLRLPVALVYWLWRGILSKLSRGQWRRLGAAWRGYRDFLLEAFRRTAHRRNDTSTAR